MKVIKDKGFNELFRKFALVGAKDWRTLADNIYAEDKTITVKVIRERISGIRCQIRVGKQPCWKPYRLIDTDKEFRLVIK